MGLGLKRKMKNVSSNSTKSVFTKKDIEKALKMSNLGNVPKGTDGTKGMVGKIPMGLDGTKGMVGKKVKAINTKVEDIDDIFEPKV